jgi:hypothetical protein
MRAGRQEVKLNPPYRYRVFGFSTFFHKPKNKGKNKGKNQGKNKGKNKGKTQGKNKGKNKGKTQGKRGACKRSKIHGAKIGKQRYNCHCLHPFLIHPGLQWDATMQQQSLGQFFGAGYIAALHLHLQQHTYSTENCTFAQSGLK